MPEKLKRKKQQSLLPTELLSTLESSDKLASSKRRKQFTSHTLPKSLATKSQFDIQTNLIESRILLQRALTCFDDGDGDGDGDTNLSQLLEELQTELVTARYALCAHILKNDEDDDQDENDDSQGENNKNEKYSDDTFQTPYNKLQAYWKKVLNRHYDNMNITKRFNKKDSNSNAKFFDVVDQSFWSQVENTVQHNMILEQHSHSQVDLDNQNVKAKAMDTSKVQFDDTKIYQQMLQEYITLSSERNSNNASSLAEQRLKLASSKKKSNKEDDIDRRASKGRKIRYVVHEKLTNFTFPLQREVNSQIAMTDEDVLFKSMFGGALSRGRKKKVHAMYE